MEDGVFIVTRFIFTQQVKENIMMMIEGISAR